MVAVLRAGIVLIMSTGTTDLGVPVPSQKISLICSRSMPMARGPAEVLVFNHLAISGSLIVGQVELDDQVAAVVSRVEIDLVAATLLVLQEDRYLPRIEMSEQLVIILAGHGPQVEHLLVLRQGKHDLSM